MCFFSSCVYTADAVNINITGNIVAGPCVVNGGASDQNVNLGSIKAADLAAPGSSSTAILFTLAITNCPSGTNVVKAKFDGYAQVDAPNSYKNSGTAGNVSVNLYDSVTGNILGPGSSVSKTVQSDRTASIALKASAYSLKGNASSGTINSAIVVSMTYQ